MAEIWYPERAKTAKLPSGVTYSYVHVAPAEPQKPTILFLHGFPSSSYDWRHQVKYFASKGYGILVPDLLGYGGTDKPAVGGYGPKAIASQVNEIVQLEKLGKIHGVAHDFGSSILSRLIVYHSDILISSTFLAVPFFKPGAPFDVDSLNSLTSQIMGFGKFGYMKFFARDDSWKLIDQHPESFYSIIYADVDDSATEFYPEGKLESWLREDRRAPPSPFVTQAEKEIRDRIFAHGYQGPTNWYRSMFQGVGRDEEAQDDVDATIKHPVLVILETPGVATVEMFAQATPPYAADIRTLKTSTKGHWLQLEAKDEVNTMLGDFFQEVDGKAGK